MQYRKLGKTGLKVSVIGVGTWQFGGEWGHDYTQQEVDRILHKAKDTGINLIDTAECYGDHLSEAFIGEFLQRGRREDWVVATKFGHKFHSHLQRTTQYGAQEVLQQLEDSLRALRTDYIDLYQFHSGDDQAFDNDDLWTMLDKQVQAGKIRHIGLSLNKSNSMHQTSAASKVGAGAIQVVYNRLDRGPEADVFPACMDQDLGVLARVPLASGYLSGKYRPGAEFAANDVRHNHDRAAVDEKLKQAEEIKRTEVPQDVNMAEWALAWCLRHEAVTCVIPGCKNEAQVESNARAALLAPTDHPQIWRH
ncbi:aldo/keto reductase [Paenibacillus apiarius]|uniref:Aldo/keto reductase n=1 Tax=Paenibacillus apiarius TaxID=46240 RepID=A0ABT4DT49_9BACL|nr:aldo/keto reductase [Paenibacillus apiarius]MCY9515756.1 aldo/keto reductase [Paenibacillus apiarius]MCY9520430.1 aldo/keto reductase [Paenibacillus apiarius]MCY9555468.1 aldo/keto reductase [Paenibacillus apiarius]MCY9559084.1 aldo/keto reductase [Paenibacillus apiarius]MCY9685665.1 aldo/keto reductase [Paenibacillus apiarius]